MSSRFVLVNEYLPSGASNSATEILGVYDDYDSAWAQLSEEASGKNQWVSADSDYFQVNLPESSYLDVDEYYIIEFPEGERVS